MPVEVEKNKGPASGDAGKPDEKDTTKGAAGAADADDSADDESDDSDDGKSGKTEVDAAFLKKLKDENAQRRRENKELREKLKAKEKPEDDPNAKARADFEAQTSAKMRNALLRSELAEAAKDVHSVSVLLRADPKLFADVDVDVDSESVDRDSLEDALKKARKLYPFMFSAKDEKGAKTKTPDETKPGTKPLDTGRSSGGDNHYTKWKSLNESDKKAATAYYAAHKAEILAQMKMSS